MACPAALKLQRRSKSYEQRVAISTTTIQVLPPSATRTAIVISAIGPSRLWIGFDRNTQDGVGLLLPVNGQPLCLHIGDYGDIVRRGLWAVAPDGDGVFNAWVSEIPEPIEG